MTQWTYGDGYIHDDRGYIVAQHVDPSAGKAMVDAINKKNTKRAIGHGFRLTVSTGKPVFPGDDGRIVYSVETRDDATSIILRKEEIDANDKLLDVKELSLETAWRMIWPQDFPKETCGIQYNRAVSVVSELYRDKVLTEYQFNLILSAIGR